MDVHVRYYAGAAKASGVDAATVTMPDDATWYELINGICGNDNRLRLAFLTASLVSAGRSVDDWNVPIWSPSLDVLPPYAGG